MRISILIDDESINSIGMVSYTKIPDHKYHDHIMVGDHEDVVCEEEYVIELFSATNDLFFYGDNEEGDHFLVRRK
jgi:hypothetical protein